MSFLASLKSFIPLFDWLRSPPQPTGPFTPDYKDVCHARALLKALQLPTELALDILDRARYWPSYEFNIRPDREMATTAGVRSASAATLCLDAGIFDNSIANDIRAGGERLKMKTIEFDIVSHDQGWTSEDTQGTYSTSSWLEVSILRNGVDSSIRLPDSRLMNTWVTNPLDLQAKLVRGWFLASRPKHAIQGPQDGEGDLAWYLQGNRVAAGRQNYRIVWAEDGSEGNEGAGEGEGFLQELQDGDRILIWARAKWPGWSCTVESIKVTVRYGF